MDLGDMMEQAKDAVKNVSDDHIEKAKDFVDAKVDDKYDGMIDKVTDQAKKLND